MAFFPGLPLVFFGMAVWRTEEEFFSVCKVFAERKEEDDGGR